MALGTVGLLLLFFVIAASVLVAWLMAISLFVDSARMKGYYRDGGSGALWFIGIFATPIVVGIYVASLPDKKLHNDAAREDAANNVLPSV